MLSQVYDITDSATTQQWVLKEMLGHPFEDFIAQFIRYSFQENGYFWNNQVSIEQTTGSNDGGKDIIIISTITIPDLFGYEFPLNENIEQKIYIECKSSESGAIDYNKLSGGVQRASNQKISAYVVVTNTTVVPYCFYQLKETAAQYGIRFLLIDQYILAKELSKKNMRIGDYIPLNWEAEKEIKYQILTNNDSVQQNCEVYFLIRNYNDDNLFLQFSLASNRNWKWDFDYDYIPVSLGPHESTCERIRITRYFNDGQESLQFILHDGHNEIEIALRGVKWDTSFIPPLCGQRHHATIQNIRESIVKSTNLQLFFVHGEAGVGKTRIIQQLCMELKKTAIYFESYSYSSRRKKVVKAIREFCIKKKMLPSECKSNALSEIVFQIDAYYRKQVFIIDDIHNAPDEFYDDIAKLIQQTYAQPLIFILIGRDDYTAGNNAYFNFLSYAENHAERIRHFPLYPLEPDESKGLIRSLLSDVPEYALEQIFDLSNNLPLFIVQFTEYLLDLNLAYIVNRNSVSLKNRGSFSLHDYLPKKVEEVYAARFKYIGSLPNGIQIQTILLGLSFWGSEFPENLVVSWDERNYLDYLFSHDFLELSNGGNFRFVHESMYLYFRHLIFSSKRWKKRIAKKIKNENSLFWYSLNSLEQARLFLWLGKTDDADRLFSLVYPEIESFNNFSSVIVTPEIEDYLYDIYDCQKKKTCFPEKFVEKIYQYKAYISLHYASPAAAIEVCNRAEKEIVATDTFRCGEAFSYILKELKAHSYLNMGLYQTGFHLLQELLAMTLSKPEKINTETLFDLYDRLSSVYMKYNQKTLALEFNQLSYRVAKTLDDPHLLTLSNITRAKILFFNDFIESQKWLAKASDHLLVKPDLRILCHNNITRLITDFRSEYVPGQTKNYMEYIQEAQSLLEESLQNNYANSILRTQLFLATLFYLNKNSSIARRYMNQGIDSCVKFGYGTYIWHFYNLRAILDTSIKENHCEVQKSIETVYRMLRQQNLLFLGNCDLTYENMIALTNIASFYKNDETEYYRKLSLISAVKITQSCNYDCEKGVCQYICESQSDLYRKEKKRLLEKKILFADSSLDYPLLDPETNYFFLLS